MEMSRCALHGSFFALVSGKVLIEFPYSIVNVKKVTHLLSTTLEVN